MFWSFGSIGYLLKEAVRLGNAIGRYSRIRITSKDKTPRNPWVAEALRAQVLWVD